MITTTDKPKIDPKHTFFIGSVEPDYDTKIDTHKKINIDQSLLAIKRKSIQETIRSNGITNPRLLADIGQINGDRGKTNAAKKAFTTAIAQSPNNINIRMKYVNTLIKLNKYEDALGQIEHIEKLIDNDSRISIKRLQILFDLSYKNNGSKYVLQFNNVIKKYLNKFKDEYKIYNIQGMFNALVLKDLTGAEKCLQKSLSIKENYIALTNLGSCYWDSNNLKTAKVYFKKAIKFDEKEELAHINLINLLITEQKFNQALNHINDSKKYVSNNGAPYLYQKGWLLLKNGQPEAALEWNLNVIKSYPDNYRLYNNIGNCYERLNNTEEAFKNYLKSINLSKKIKLGPDDLKQYYNALLLADSQMDNDKIIYIANQLLAVDQRSIPALYTIALAKIRRKKFEESKDYLKKIIKINPTFHNAYVSLSFIYSEIDDNQEDAILLLESADEVVDKTDQGDGFYNNLAYAYIKNGLLDEAEKTLALTNDSGYANSTAALLELYKGHENKYATLFKNSFNKFKESEISFAMQSFYFEEAYYNATIKNDNKKALKLLDEVVKINITSFYADKARKLIKQISR